MIMMILWLVFSSELISLIRLLALYRLLTRFVGCYQPAYVALSYSFGKPTFPERSVGRKQILNRCPPLLWDI